MRFQPLIPSSRSFAASARPDLGRERDWLWLNLEGRPHPMGPHPASLGPQVTDPASLGPKPG